MKLLRVCGVLPALVIFASLGRAEVAWPVGKPEEHGFNRARLDAARERLAAHGTHAFLVARDGKLIYEWYAEGWNSGRRHYTASLAKALVGGLSLLVALQDGRIKPDDPAAKYILRWRDHPQKSKITIRHLATHTSGIEDAEQDGLPHDKLPGWKGAFWQRKPDPISIALDQAPVIFEPGTRYAYSNPGMAALAYAVTAALRGAPEADIRTLLARRIMEPLGIGGEDWSISYGETYELDGLKVCANWGGGNFTPRATARVFQMLADEGVWQGKRLLEARFIRQVMSYAGMPLPPRKGALSPGSGLAFYTNFDGIWRKVPHDAFAGAGAGHQVAMAVPSLKLVVVRNGGDLIPKRDDRRFWNSIVELVFDPVMDALAAPPYPPSTVIRRVTFAPPSEIIRQAIDSDNWPITWGDDDHLYTSYGDGRGFDPPTELKLSLGLSRVEGSPPNFRGVNIRSKALERTGDGVKGPKASGLIMVDGVLYMWVRNVGNAQLLWSVDRGRSWTWGFKLETSFGSPAFLNFGRNNAGARDDYVYTYSQDGPSAYEQDDAVVLARAPKTRLRERVAWEFFERLDGSGNPVWTADIHRRGPVFSYPRNVERVDAVYNPGLRRYLLAVGYNHAGGWGIFEAPEPWGPWSVAFHSHNWGLPGTHGYRLPSKWISEDGRTMWLVFSGRTGPGLHYDAFSVRKMNLE